MYSYETGAPIYNINVAKQGVVRLVLQDNGNLELQTAKKKVLWSTETDTGTKYDIPGKLFVIDD